MPKTMNLNVRISGDLKAHVETNVGEQGSYENTSEYIRSLIREDKRRSEAEAFDRLKAELQAAFAAPDNGFQEVSADDVIKRNARHR